MKLKLVSFFMELLVLGMKYDGGPGWGNPTSSLAEYVTERGLIKFVDGMLALSGEDQWWNSHEYRLNGAGLKMLWHARGTTGGVKVAICGDQIDYYQDFVSAARELINRYGFNEI